VLKERVRRTRNIACKTSLFIVFKLKVYKSADKHEFPIPGYPTFTKEMTEYPLKATMSDGVFEDICADSRDFTTAVNIKKGILSTLQNSLPSNATMYNEVRLTEVI